MRSLLSELQGSVGFAGAAVLYDSANERRKELKSTKTSTKRLLVDAPDADAVRELQLARTYASAEILLCLGLQNVVLEHGQGYHQGLVNVVRCSCAPCTSCFVFFCFAGERAAARSRPQPRARRTHAHSHTNVSSNPASGGAHAGAPRQPEPVLAAAV